ncbi:MAG: PaaI family thioesterase [Pseudomonadota bacterium]|nr:PaaI family thioesterase [Pseudomonadota bacterium]
MDMLAALYAPGSPEADYWQARHRLAKTARYLNEKLVSADITPELADAIREDLERIASRLEACEQVSGLVEMGRKADRGTVDNVMGELVAMAGRSHPCAPQLIWREELNQITGTVTFGQAFEGPPGHTHGGWVAGILDHIMGMTHVRTGHPGMTGGLSIRYLKPTPLHEVINISAVAVELDDKRTEVKATMSWGEVTTATAEAIFVRVDSARFGFDAA